MNKQYIGAFKRCILIGIALMMTFALCAMCACGKGKTDASGNPIKSITAIGFMDYDGPKLKAMALEYEQDLTGANVDKSTYEIAVLSSINCDYIGNGKIGDIVNVYVNDKIETSERGGSGSGKYVIIEVFTDYTSATNLVYTRTMSARAKQVKDIELGDGTVIPAYDEFANNISGATTTSYSFVFPELEGFKYYTNNPGEYGADGGAWHVENCFNQQDGKYYDVDVSYALYLPEGYSENGRYAMVTIQNPAAAASTHPLTSVLTYRSASVYVSDWAQQLVKDEHGLDGLIVLVPVVTQRVNDNGGTPAEYEAIVNLWDHVIEEYHVDSDYVYGSGQSVGGMILLETNRNRDNFFAGMLLYDDQWAQNYYIDTIFARDMVALSATANTAEMHYPRNNGTITWDYSLDTAGEKVYEGHDPYNYYYLISDDNILVLNCTDNNLSNDAWTELKYLYYDTTGYELERLVIDAADGLDKQNSELSEYLGRNNALNINWASLENATEGFHNRKLTESYEWLLSQNRREEVSREKLDLNKPFELADEQLTTDERKTDFTLKDGSPVYYLTAKQGAGTQFYNSAWFNTNVIADAVPGWLPAGMSWETGVSGAHIESVTAIGSNAVAIEYDVNMENIVINLKGDKVYNHISGEYRDNDLIAVDPYEFYDADGNRIECTIKNVYVSQTAEVRSGAERGSGTGCYVIVEFEGGLSAAPAGVVQLTTVRTNTVIASASHLLRGVDDGEN